MLLQPISTDRKTFILADCQEGDMAAVTFDVGRGALFKNQLLALAATRGLRITICESIRLSLGAGQLWNIDQPEAALSLKPTRQSLPQRFLLQH